MDDFFCVVRIRAVKLAVISQPAVADEPAHFLVG